MDAVERNEHVESNQFAHDHPDVSGSRSLLFLSVRQERHDPRVSSDHLKSSRLAQEYAGNKTYKETQESHNHQSVIHYPPYVDAFNVLISLESVREGQESHLRIQIRPRALTTKPEDTI